MIRFTIPGLRLPNHANGSQGVSVGAMHARKRERASIRRTAEQFANASVRRESLSAQAFILGAEPVVVTVTRIAPSDGLDEHDGLPNACKPVVDGIADALGLPRDRSDRVTWLHDQRRGPWGVEVTIAARETCPHCGAVVRGGRAA